MTGATLLDKLWDAHVVVRGDDGLDLLHIDRSYLTDLSGTIGLEETEASGRRVRDPGLHVAIPDHVVSSSPTPQDHDALRHRRFVAALVELADRAGIRHLGRDTGMQGIVHVVGPELGLTLPGMTVVCGDSHTSTHGALGALAFGIGSSEVAHVLATSTLWLQRPKRARIRLEGRLASGVHAKDAALWLIGNLGADWGREHAVEFAGPAVDAMGIEARATLCNMAVELGARFGLVAPDHKTLSYLDGKPYAPRAFEWSAMSQASAKLRSDHDATFDKHIILDASIMEPQVTWGISPEHVGGVGGSVPPDADAHATRYMGVDVGEQVARLSVDYVFIGSCANARLDDLREAAAVIRGRSVFPGVTAWVVPGSQSVKAAAEAEGLDRLFRTAGFEWREPGCSMCVGVNGDLVPPGKRCVSTSNRNFIGRQGPEARTHLASPATAAASAIAGVIADPRAYMES